MAKLFSLALLAVGVGTYTEPVHVCIIAARTRVPEWPFDDPSAVVFTIFLEGPVRGLVQYGEELAPL